MSMPIITSSGVTRCDAITDIIESVALQQTGLSHILNAEGEKIQAVLALATDTDELLEVNKSVESMVNSITRLEVILQGKLELFKDCVCEDCETTDDVEVTLVLSDETAGTIREITDKNYTYVPGDLDNSISFVTDPASSVTLLSELPDGFKFEDGILYIPADADIKEDYELQFQIGDNPDCIVTIFITKP